MLVGVILPEVDGRPARSAGRARLAGQDRRREGRRHDHPEARSGRTPAPTSARGKAMEIAHLAKKQKADVVIFDNDLSPGADRRAGEDHQRGDRHASAASGHQGARPLRADPRHLRHAAQTHEAKLQVELAQMQYTYPRLTRMWGHLERIAGGGRRDGHRHARAGRNAARNRPPNRPQAHLRSEGATSRRCRSARAGWSPSATATHFTVCIVGYTNAGKSTLFNTLTAAGHVRGRQAVRDARHEDARVEARARDGSAAERHRRLRPRSAAQPRRSRSRRRWKKRSTPTCCCTCSTSAIRTRSSSSIRSTKVLEEIGVEGASPRSCC